VEGRHFFIKYGFLARRDGDYPGPRIAFIVGRKIGPSCFRHRIKRLAREAFRLHQHELPAGLDLLWVARRTVPDDWKTLQGEFRSLIARLPSLPSVRASGAKREENPTSPPAIPGERLAG